MLLELFSRWHNISIAQKHFMLAASQLPYFAVFSTCTTYYGMEEGSLNADFQALHPMYILNIILIPVNFKFLISKILNRLLCCQIIKIPFAASQGSSILSNRGPSNTPQKSKKHHYYYHGQEKKMIHYWQEVEDPSQH